MSNGESVGEMLRNAREAKNLTVAQAHQSTKISVEVLESLEQDDFGAFASETYLKGFLRSYAQFLGLDADKLWSRVSRRKSGEPGAEGVAATTDTYWDVEEGVREERIKSTQIFRRIIVPLMLVVILVLTILLVREHRKVESLKTGARTPQHEAGVLTVASEL